MATSRVNLLNSYAKQRKLRVVHVATQAIPFIKSNLSKGLPEAAGRIPAALASLGLDTSLVLPFFKTIEENIEYQEYELEDLGILEIRFGTQSREARIKTMLSPLEPHYPV